MPEPSGAPLRFGVSLSGREAPAAFAAALRELIATDGVTLAAVVEEDEPEARPRRRTLWDAYLWLRPLRTIPGLEPVDVARDLDGVPRVEAADLEALRARRLDFILRQASGPLSPGLAELPAYGVWAFHRCDEGAPRGGPMGFWEIHDGTLSAGAILQRLTGRPGEGVTLRSCFVRTQRNSYRRTLAAIGRATVHMPASAARDILHGSAPSLDAPPVATDLPTPRAPTNRETLRFLGRLARAATRAHLESIFLLERWHVGIVRAPIHSFLAESFEPVIEWLPHRKRHGFLADPFVVSSGTRRTVLMEEWDDRSRVGRIVAGDLGDGAGASLKPVLQLPTHLAYPYVFEHDGRVFCTPENALRRGVFLYELEAGGMRWTERGTLLHDVAAVDPTIVRHAGRWWLFCTDADDGGDFKLLVWHARELLGSWEPHPGNPVKADIRSSRPAGTPFVHEGELYRPAQDSAGGYGSAVVLNRVTRLTTTEYAEEPVARFAPPPGSPYPAGAHTLAAAGELTAVDGKRMVIVPRLVAPRIAYKLVRLAGRTRGRRAGG